MATGTVAVMFGVSFETGVWAAGSVVLIYSMLGGMWGAVVTDLIQVGVIVIAIPVLAFTTSQALGTASTAVPISELLATDFIPEGMASTAIFNILPFPADGVRFLRCLFAFPVRQVRGCRKVGSCARGHDRYCDLILRRTGRRRGQHA